LIEDNPDHAELTQRALADGGTASRVRWVRDGAEALDYLGRRGRWATAPRPGLILLDRRLPTIGGDEVLRRIKADPTLRSIPVVMLTTTDRPEEVRQAYEAGVNSFVTKPVRFQDFVERVRQIQRYWVLTNQLPRVP